MSSGRVSAPETAEVGPGSQLDWPRIDAFIRDRMPDLPKDLTVRQFTTGAANLTYLLRYGEQELVLRRQPFGSIAPGAHDMAREYKVLSRLWRHYDRAPRALLFCDDPAVGGADFFVMERRRGVVIVDEIPEAMTAHADVAWRVSRALVDAMAQLHALDPAECGLTDLGKPDGFVARQVSGWTKRWGLVRGDDGPSLMDDVARRLEASIPTSSRAAIVHNDLKLDNCMFAAEDPDRVTSIFDWDMATLGDPLVDLGTLLNYWPDPSDPPGTHRTSRSGLLSVGLPPRAQIVEWYAERARIAIESIAWYEAFAQWKTGVVIMQLYRRFQAGASHDTRHSASGSLVSTLAGSAAGILDGMGA